MMAVMHWIHKPSEYMYADEVLRLLLQRFYGVKFSARVPECSYSLHIVLEQETQFFIFN